MTEDLLDRFPILKGLEIKPLPVPTPEENEAFLEHLKQMPNVGTDADFDRHATTNFDDVSARHESD